MKKKSNFCLDNYKFNIVKMKVFNKYNSGESNNFIYFLLVDQDKFIHDYKITIDSDKFFIKPETTLSHQNNKNIGLTRRMEILDFMKIKHKFENGSVKKKTIKCFNGIENIKKLNKQLLSLDWRKITFQKIEYIVTGSNSSGQGNGKGTFKTKYKNIDYPFGFLFQCLNVNNEIDKTYANVDYSKAWEKLNDGNNILLFENWIENNMIEEYLKRFKYYCENNKWKDIKKQFEEELNKNRQEFMLLENKISKLRNKFKKEIETTYKNYDAENIVKLIYNDYFNMRGEQLYSKYDKAHIKPVWLIKKEYVEVKDEKILEQISDPFNFLPLSKNIHQLYDDKYFYWNIEGRLTKLNNKINDHEYFGFEKINMDKVKKIKKYLDEYFEKVIMNLN